MSTEQGTMIESAKDMAAAAEKIEKEAKAASAGSGSYTHIFHKPFTHEGRTYEKLTFDWEVLTGNDSLAIEREVTSRGQTLVVPAYTGAYLAGMAARACTERDKKGRRVVGTDTIRAMPLDEFQKICNRARNFLLRAGL
jgi:hypothetical protein